MAALNVVNVHVEVAAVGAVTAALLGVGLVGFPHIGIFIVVRMTCPSTKGLSAIGSLGSFLCVMSRIILWPSQCSISEKYRRIGCATRGIFVIKTAPMGQKMKYLLLFMC